MRNSLRSLYKMASTSVVEQIVQSLAFEVEAIPPIDKTELSHTTPLNLRIRVKKKEACGLEQAILSVPKFGHPERAPERIRLISSDQTIMSFDVSMEADFAKKPKRKPRKSFFGSCLGLQYDDDESTYLPSNLYNAKMADANVSSKSDGVLKQHFTLSKTSRDSGEIQPYARKPDILGKCKPGGCLDPPFGEEKYAYRPGQKQNLNRKITNIDEETTPISAKIKVQNRVDIPRSTKKSKDSLLTQKTKLNIEQNSILSLYEAISKGSADSKKSDSVITYPPELSSSKTSQDKCTKSKMTIEDKQRKSANDSVDAFFTTPRKSRLGENSKDYSKNVKNKNHEVINTTRVVSDKPENILRSKKIKPIESFSQEGQEGAEEKFRNIDHNDFTKKSMDSISLMHNKPQGNITYDSSECKKADGDANNNLNDLNSTLTPTLIDSSIMKKALRTSPIDAIDDERNIMPKNNNVPLYHESPDKGHDFRINQNQTAEHNYVPETLAITGLVASSLVDKTLRTYPAKVKKDKDDIISENGNISQESTDSEAFRTKQYQIAKHGKGTDKLTPTVVTSSSTHKDSETSSVNDIDDDQDKIKKNGNILLQQESTSLLAMKMKQNEVAEHSNVPGKLSSTVLAASSLLNKVSQKSSKGFVNDDRKIVTENENLLLKPGSTSTNDDQIQQNQIAEQNKLYDTLTSTIASSVDAVDNVTSIPETTKNEYVLLGQESSNIQNAEVPPSQRRIQDEGSALVNQVEGKQSLENQEINVENNEHIEDYSEKMRINQNNSSEKTVNLTDLNLQKKLSSSSSLSISKVKKSSFMLEEGSKINYKDKINPENPNYESPVINTKNVTSTITGSNYKSSLISLQDKPLEDGAFNDITSKQLSNLQAGKNAVRKTSAQLKNVLANNENNFMDESKFFEALGLQNNETNSNGKKEGSNINEIKQNKDANSTFPPDVFTRMSAQNSIESSLESDSLKVAKDDIEITAPLSQNIENDSLESSYSENNNAETIERNDAMKNVTKESSHYSAFNDNNFESQSLSSKSTQSLEHKSEMSDIFVHQPRQSAETEAASIKKLPPSGSQKDSHLHNNDSFENKPKTSRESKGSLKKDDISLDLAFHSYVNERKERTLKTVDASKYLDKNLNDGITVIQSQLKPNVNAIRVPVGSENDMIIQIKRTKSPTQRVQIMDEASIESERDITLQRDRDSVPFPEGHFNSSFMKEMIDKIATFEMQKVLNTIYEQELIPLQNTIKSLKEDIDKIFVQQSMLIEEFCKSKKTKPVRLLRVNSRCGCWRKL